MTTENQINRFFNLEQQATSILDELEKLRKETTHYSTAATGLDTSMNQLASVAGDLKDLTGRLKDVIETLRNIGTPELLASSQAVQDEVKLLKTDIFRLREETTAQLKVIADLQRRGYFEKLLGRKPHS